MASSNIHSIGIIKKEPNAPVEGVVQALREALKNAKNGQTRGICIISVELLENGQLMTQSNFQKNTEEIYYALRTAVTNTFIRLGMIAINPDFDRDLVDGPELNDDDE